MRTLIFLALLTFPLSLGAQAPDSPDAAVAEPTAATEPVATEAPAPDVVKVEGDKVTVNDVVTDAKGVADAVRAYKDAQKAGDKLAIRLGLMALLAAIFKVLLSTLKFSSEFWKGKKGKLVLRISTLVLGIAVTLTAHLAAGETWVSALLLGISGPLAISFHELFDVIVALVQKKPAVDPAK